jgi:hypothetical protein
MKTNLLGRTVYVVVDGVLDDETEYEVIAVMEGNQTYPWKFLLAEKTTGRIIHRLFPTEYDSIYLQEYYEGE